jgi:hypothetical protein
MLFGLLVLGAIALSSSSHKAYLYISLNQMAVNRHP